MYALYVEKRNIIENIMNSIDLRGIFSRIVTFREQSLDSKDSTQQLKLRLEFIYFYL